MTHANQDVTKTPLLNNLTYDVLNNIVTLGLPAAGAFYFGLATLWDWPAAEQVVGTCAVLAVFAGVLIKISKSSYGKTVADKDGVINVYPQGDGTFAAAPIDILISPEELLAKKNLTIAVNPIDESLDSQN